MTGGTLADQVYEQLRQQIVVGELAPGQRLNLAEIAGTLGMSRMPVRDAITRLVAEGLVEVRPRSGTRVTTRDFDDAAERHHGRLLLEPGVVEAVATGASDDFLADLERIQDEWERIDPWQVYRDYDLQRRYRSLHDRFHIRIVEETNNALVVGMLTQIVTGSGITPSFFGTSYTGPVFRMTEHRVILEALRRHDGRAAAEAMRVHLKNGWDDIVKFLQSAEDQRPRTIESEMSG